MRRIFHLIGLECKLLVRTIVLIGLILTLFSSALLSVVSVVFDVPEGLYGYHSAFAGRLNLAAADTTIGEVKEHAEGWAFGVRAGLTSDVAVTGSKRYTLPVCETHDNPFPNQSVTTAFALMAENFVLVEESIGFRPEGEWPTAPGEAAITSLFGNSVGAKLGDTVKVGEREFLITAIIDSDTLDPDRKSLNAMPIRSAYLCVDGNEQLDFCYLGYSDSRLLRSDSVSLKEAGFTVFLTDATVAIYQNIDLVRAFFSAIAAVLAITALFILYCLIAMFYRQRRTQICRMKLVGAREGTIAGIYCTVAVLLGTVAIALGTAGSVLFNLFFMRLCSYLFEWEFASHFHPIVPFELFATMVVFVLILYAIFSKKIKNARIAEEVKHE